MSNCDCEMDKCKTMSQLLKAKESVFRPSINDHTTESTIQLSNTDPVTYATSRWLYFLAALHTGN